MLVFVTDRLAKALSRKGLRFIVLDVALCKSCGGAVGQLFARPASAKEAERLVEDASIRRVPCSVQDGSPLHAGEEAAELLVVNPDIALREPVVLDKGMLGIADIKVTGARY